MNHFESVVVFDGSSYFVEDSSYILEDCEEIVYRGTLKNCADKAEELNDLL